MLQVCQSVQRVSLKQSATDNLFVTYFLQTEPSRSLLYVK